MSETTWHFDGDFDVLPLRAQFLFGPVPSHPTSGDFHLAVSDVEHHHDEPAAHWRLEAIRARIRHQGRSLAELRGQIITATAARLYAIAIE